MAYYGMMGDGGLAMGFYGLAFFAIASFVFSAIFWWTHNWLVKDRHRKE